MKDFFRLIETPETGEEGRLGLLIGMDVNIAGRDEAWPLSRVCRSYDELAAEVGDIQKNLDHILERGEALFKGSTAREEMSLSSDMNAQEIWSILSQMEDDRLAKTFNGMNERKRRDVAEYILTQTNIFSGKSSSFSARYNSESALMD